MYHLYKKVFNNIVLSNLIFSFCRLYKKNTFKKFKQIQSLIEYQEREYIESLYYKDISGHLLKVGDLPIGSVLKNLTINSLSNLESGECIPHGVETIRFVHTFQGKKYYDSIPLTSLPSTVHTIKNILLLKATQNESNHCVYTIPPNIKSISFLDFIQWSISKEAKNNFIEIPNTIEKLKFLNGCNNQGLPIQKGDLSSSLKTLVINDYTIRYSNDSLPNGLIKLQLSGLGRNFKELILPDTLKFLKLSFKITNNDDCRNIVYNEIFNKLPSNLEELYIKFFMCISKISKNSNLSKCKSIKKFTIQYEYSNFNQPIIELKSLPSSITDLSLINIANEPLINFPFPKNIKKLLIKTNDMCSYGNQRILINKSIPDSITSLALNFIIKSADLFPSSLTHFRLLEIFYYNSKRPPVEEEIQPMISILPKSLIYLELPDYSCDSLYHVSGNLSEH
ncbi:hypothetical protein ACTFIZ_002858 [Dictyostelium cf. discoideum]